MGREGSLELFHDTTRGGILILGHLDWALLRFVGRANTLKTRTKIDVGRFLL